MFRQAGRPLSFFPALAAGFVFLFALALLLGNHGVKLLKRRIAFHESPELIAVNRLCFDKVLSQLAEFIGVSLKDLRASLVRAVDDCSDFVIDF